MKCNKEIDKKIEVLFSSVGDMSLKRRAAKILSGLDLMSGGKIIDIGCGDGYYLHLLSSLPINNYLLGFDYDKIVLDNARKNLGNKKIKLVNGSATNMQFNDNSFDNAIMTEVLEHIEDDKKALSEVYRIIKPKGVLLLTVPNFNFPFLWDPINWLLQRIFGIHISGTGFFAGIWARHIRLYKKGELITLVQKAGFKVEETEDLTTRCLPFNHYLVNLVARFLYDVKPSQKLTDPISKFKNVKKPLMIQLAFFLVNSYDKINNIFPGKHGLNIYIKAVK